MDKIEQKAEAYSNNNAKFVADDQSAIMLQKAFEAGANEVIQHPQEYIDCCVSGSFLEVLEENYAATKRGLVDEDKVRPAQEILEETYEDLISIYKAAQTKPDCCAEEAISIIDELVNKAASVKDIGFAHKRAKNFLEKQINK